MGCRVTLLPDDRSRCRTVRTRAAADRGRAAGRRRQRVRRAARRSGPSWLSSIPSRPQTASRWLDLVRELGAPAPRRLRHRRPALAPRGAKGRRCTTDAVPHASKANALRELELALIRATTPPWSSARRARPGQAPTFRASRFGSPPCQSRRAPRRRLSRTATVSCSWAGSSTRPTSRGGAAGQGCDADVWRALGPVPVTIVGGSVPPGGARARSAHVDIAGWVKEIESLLDRARVDGRPAHMGRWAEGQGDPVARRRPAGRDDDDRCRGSRRHRRDSCSSPTTTRRWPSAWSARSPMTSCGARSQTPGEELVDGLCSPAVMRIRSRRSSRRDSSCAAGAIWTRSASRRVPAELTPRRSAGHAEPRSRIATIHRRRVMRSRGSLKIAL